MARLDQTGEQHLDLRTAGQTWRDRLNQAGALARIGGVGALSSAHYLKALPEGIHGALSAEPGGRLEGFSQGMDRSVRSHPGGEWLMKQEENARQAATQAGVGSGLQFLADVGMPDAGDLGRLARATGNLAAFKGVHDSPHLFNAFSHNPGKGTGGEMQGPGHYFSSPDNPKVSEKYRELFGDPGEQVTVGGKPVVDVPMNQLASTIHSSKMDEVAAERRLQGSLRRNPHDRRAVQSEMDEFFDTAIRMHESTSTQGSDDAIARLQIQRRLIDGWLRQPDLKSEALGPYNYQVTIDAEPEEFLDWDAPFSEQPDFIQDIILKEFPDVAETNPLSAASPKMNWGGEPTGRHIFERLYTRHNKDWDTLDATEALRERGVKGTRYLDYGSRGTRHADILVGGSSLGDFSGHNTSTLTAANFLSGEGGDIAMARASLSSAQIDPGVTKQTMKVLDEWEALGIEVIPQDRTYNTVVYPGNEHLIRQDRVIDGSGRKIR